MNTRQSLIFCAGCVVVGVFIGYFIGNQMGYQNEHQYFLDHCTRLVANYQTFCGFPYTQP
jgi:hypothetical protein